MKLFHPRRLCPARLAPPSSTGGFDDRGATAIEFALVAPLLMLLLIGTLECGMAAAAAVMLKSATYTAARTGRTGFVASDATQDQTVRTIIARQAGVLMDGAKISILAVAYSGFDALNKPEPFVDANGNGTRDDGENYTDINGNGRYDLDQGAAGYGEADAVVVYTVTYPWTFFTPLVGQLFSDDGTITLSATAIVQNEDY